MDINVFTIYQANYFIKTTTIVQQSFNWLHSFNKVVCKHYNINEDEGKVIIKYGKRVFKRLIMAVGPLHESQLLLAIITCYMIALKYTMDLPEVMHDGKLVEHGTRHRILPKMYTDTEHYVFNIVAEHLMHDLTST